MSACQCPNQYKKMRLGSGTEVTRWTTAGAGGCCQGDFSAGDLCSRRQRVRGGGGGRGRAGTRMPFSLSTQFTFEQRWPDVTLGPDPADRAGGCLPLRPGHASRSAYRALSGSVIIGANWQFPRRFGLVVTSVVARQTAWAILDASSQTTWSILLARPGA
jgi:hypothetical protein